MLTTCTCDNGFQGDTLLVPGPTPTTTPAPNPLSILLPTPAGSNSSILLCRFDATNYTISTLGPAPTPSAAVEIYLQFAEWMEADHTLSWFVFQFPDADTKSTDAAPEQKTCDWDAPGLPTWSNGTSMWAGRSDVNTGNWSVLSRTRAFPFPSTQLENGTFDIGGHSGCRYKEDPDGLNTPGSLSCEQPAGELDCQEDPRQTTLCPNHYYMVPKLWCPLPV